jgi:hypothetical protein
MTFAAQKAAKEVDLPLTDVFAYQFTLAPTGMFEVAGFATRPFGRRTLHHCPKLDVVGLRDNDGVEIGYCLGVAVDAGGQRVLGGKVVDTSIGSHDFWQDIETFAIGLGGRWLLLINDGQDVRIFGDASGHYNCVYDPKTGIVGATLLMSLDREIEESDEVDYRQTLTNGLRLPFGRTRDKHARRLAVNHYLRLDDMTETRFWPRADDMAPVDEDGFQRVITTIRDRLGAIFNAIVTTSPTAVGMSGGNDSRNVVAAGKDGLPHVSRFFTHVHNRNSRADYQSAVEVMKVLGHQVERHQAADTPYTDKEIKRRNAVFERSTGFCVGLHQMSNVRLENEPIPGEVIVIGNVMEALRAAHWNSGERSGRHTLKFGLKRCLFVSGEGFSGDFIRKWLPELKTWYAGLPKNAQHMYIDLVFVEHNLPNLGTLFHADPNNFTVCPFNDRKIIALCAQLPLNYRFSNQANSDLLKSSAPELLDVPFARDFMSAASDRTKRRGD